MAFPDLGSAEKIVREQIENQRAVVDKAMSGGDPAVAAEAWGSLGQLYSAYELGDAAVACFQNAEKLDPNVFVWPYLQGLQAQQRGDFPAAQANFSRALRHSPDYPQAHAHLVEVALALGDQAAAKEHLAKLAGKSGFEGFSQFAQGRLGSAKADPSHQGASQVSFPDPLRERLTELAISAGALLKRGNQALAEGNFDQAEALLRRGVAANPDHVELRLHLAMAQVRAQRFDDALATLKEVLAKDPRNSQAWHDLGTTYQARRLYTDAIAAFRQAIEIQPDYASAWFNLANAQVGLEQWQEAGPTIEQALQRQPSDNRLRYLQAMVLHRQGQTAPAIEKLKKLVAEEPANPVMREGLAGVLADAGRIQEALDVYRLLAEAPTTDREEAVRLLDGAAKVAWRKNQRDPAIGMWRRATELKPDSSQAWTNLANGLQLIGRRDEAKLGFARAVELDPQNAAARLSEAALLILSSDFVVAKEKLEAGLVAIPDHPALMNTLARLLSTCPIDTVRDGKRAFELAQKALAFDNRLEHAETAAMALAEMGQYEQAIRYQRSLVQQAQQRADRQILMRLMGTLQSFEKRQPIRATPQ